MLLGAVLVIESDSSRNEEFHVNNIIAIYAEM